MLGLAPGTIGIIISAAGLLLGLAASAHVLLHKRRPESAFGWVGVCLLLPVGGPLLYFLFGINRVRTRATKLRQSNGTRLTGRPARVLQESTATQAEGDGPIGVSATNQAAQDRVLPAMGLPGMLVPDTGLPDIGIPDEPITGTGSDMIGASADIVPPGIVQSGALIGADVLVSGNRVHPLHNGEETFPEMLRCIRNARRRILLSTYIFESNAGGLAFVDALAEAAARGVEVRVLLDGIGELYSRPRLRKILRHRGVRYARFLPPSILPPSFRINLRNHRKMLIVDEQTAFVGGINIGDRHLANRVENPRRVVDLHFKVEGPVAKQIEAIFLRDWRFASGETLMPLAQDADRLDAGLPAEDDIRPTTDKEPETANYQPQCYCRTLADGPDEGIDRLVALLLAAIGSATRRVYIMTPYFLPPRELIGALQSAALRGVDVSVVLPELNNLPYVHRATRHMLWEVLRRGVKVYYQPPPFVHSKMLLIDDAYSQVGSANWDARSLRLNFELALEVFDGKLNAELADHFADARRQSREVTLDDVNGRPVVTKIIDGVCWMMGPYL